MNLFRFLVCLLLAWTPLAGAQEMTSMRLPDAVVHVHVDADQFRLPKSELLGWVERSAQTVSRYYDRFPVDELYIALRPVAGSGVKNGKAFGEGPATINVRIGRDSSPEDLEADWIMVHEMVHFAFPRMKSAHHWIEEGLAVYVESIARANAGELTPEFVWKGLLKGMPYGLPTTGDRGLDHTPTWGRTYWGGAMFCMLADIEIRKRSDQRKSLRDGLRAIVAQDFSMLDSSSLESMLEIADAATGETVLMELYRQHRADALMVDLPALWRSLGVSLAGDEVVFDEAAPLAAIRRAMTAVEQS